MEPIILTKIWKLLNILGHSKSILESSKKGKRIDTVNVASFSSQSFPI
jgi:hypothetical protein